MINNPALERVLVSCLMVTRPSPERLAYIARSVEAYLGQSHSNKELLVVVDPRASSDDRAALARFLSALSRPDIRAIEGHGANALGGLRNLTLDHAQGDVLCQWDDDDLCHPERIACQLRLLIEEHLEAVYLQEVMQLLKASRALYWTNWRATEAGAHPGTLMMRRGIPVRYAEAGSSANLGEDLDLAQQLLSRGKVGRLAGQAPLFVYVSHGANSWGDDHHRMLVSELAVSRGLLARREQDIRAALASFDFGPGDVIVSGSNGEAFRIGQNPRRARPARAQRQSDNP